jgi:hypothetical protein
MYEVITNELGVSVIMFTSEDGFISWIPEDESNTDYQAYLAWVEENN